MRTYRILRDKARRMREDREIQEVLAAVSSRDRDLSEYAGPFDRRKAERLKGETFDRAAIAAPGLMHERLDQLVTELLLGVR